MVRTLQQINIFHIIFIGDICLSSSVSLLILEERKPYKIKSVLTQNNPSVSRMMPETLTNFYQHPHSSMTYAGNFCTKEIFDPEKGNMLEVKDYQAFRNQVNYQVQSSAYTDTKSYNCAKLWPTDRAAGWHLLCEMSLPVRRKKWILSASSLFFFFPLLRRLWKLKQKLVCFCSPSSCFQIPCNLLYLAQCSLRGLEHPTWLLVGKTICNSILHLWQ